MIDLRYTNILVNACEDLMAQVDHVYQKLAPLYHIYHRIDALILGLQDINEQILALKKHIANLGAKAPPANTSLYGPDGLVAKYSDFMKERYAAEQMNEKLLSLGKRFSDGIEALADQAETFQRENPDLMNERDMLHRELSEMREAVKHELEEWSGVFGKEMEG